MKRIKITLLIFALLILVATAAAAAPVNPGLTIEVRPNEPVSLRCAGDEWIVTHVGGGELVVTCRVWVESD